MEFGIWNLEFGIWNLEFQHDAFTKPAMGSRQAAKIAKVDEG